MNKPFVTMKKLSIFLLLVILIPQHGYSCPFCGGLAVKKPDFLIGLAESGDPKAQNLLAKMYKKGWSFAQDEEKSFYWLKKSAENGFTRSFHSLGVMYLEARGTERNVQKGIDWLEKSAIAFKGGISAKYLGGFYSEDQDHQNSIKAYQWLKIYSYNIECKEITQIRSKMKPDEIKTADYLADEWITRVKNPIVSKSIP